jgi:hypothetical protein
VTTTATALPHIGTEKPRTTKVPPITSRIMCPRAITRKITLP